MKIGLKVIASSQQTFTWSHEGPDVHVGRDPECELHLGGDENQVVSWRHCLIELRPGGAFLSDCGTTNGTFLNGRRIETRVMLHLGDVIRLGHAGPQMKITTIDPASGQAENPEPPRADALLVPASQSFSTTRMMIGLVQRNQKRTMLWGGTVLAAVFAVVFLVLWRHGRQTSELGTQVVLATSEIDKTTSDLKRGLSDTVKEVSDVSRKANEVAERTRTIQKAVVEVKAETDKRTSDVDQRVSAITEKVSALTDGDADRIFCAVWRSRVFRGLATCE